ncbi:MAG: 16S rRNA (cytosine(1402)-N(4))-methyltransferase RsmH [Candidatus Omnitrophota bacterium]|nr:16S rRNA (cytosine(1402)-N(4))-methyltransferase RsmH [Candidatus Omnitrophota bacterium]
MFSHIPVLAKEVLDCLELKNGMAVLDCTVGAGGHAESILRKIGRSGRLIGIDRDDEVLREAAQRLNGISDRFKLFHSNYEDMDMILKAQKLQKVDGILLDLGPSSFQMDSPERGFSIRLNGPLDMRMDRSEKTIKASDIINGYGRPELISLFRTCGDEYFAARIADRIIMERRKRPIEDTGRLSGIIKSAVPYRYRFRRIHPATKVFMALRITVNREIESLKAGLCKAVLFLRKSSRLCVISFHSIEDRIIKNAFKDFAKLKNVKIITKKPIQPCEKEISENPRARSAKLRVIEKL